MITAHLSNGTLVLGLDAKNLLMLSEGEPLACPTLPPGSRDVHKVLLIYGHTLQDVLNEMHKRWPGTGLPEKVELEPRKAMPK